VGDDVHQEVASVSASGSNARSATLNFASWNQLEGWLRQVDRVRRAA
jgi:hypothetical protein